MRQIELQIPHLDYKKKVKENYFELLLVVDKIPTNLNDQLAIRKQLNSMPKNTTLVVELVPESGIFLSINSIQTKTN